MKRRRYGYMYLLPTSSLLKGKREEEIDEEEREREWMRMRRKDRILLSFSRTGRANFWNGLEGGDERGRKKGREIE